MYQGPGAQAGTQGTPGRIQENAELDQARHAGHRFLVGRTWPEHSIYLLRNLLIRTRSVPTGLMYTVPSHFQFPVLFDFSAHHGSGRPSPTYSNPGGQIPVAPWNSRMVLDLEMASSQFLMQLHQSKLLLEIVFPRAAIAANKPPETPDEGGIFFCSVAAGSGFLAIPCSCLPRTAIAAINPPAIDFGGSQLTMLLRSCDAAEEGSSLALSWPPSNEHLAPPVKECDLPCLYRASKCEAVDEDSFACRISSGCSGFDVLSKGDSSYSRK